MTATAPRESRADTTAKPLVYLFGGGHADADGRMKELLGGKGAGLAEMSRVGIPVPPGFTITTEVCNAYYAAGATFPAGLAADVRAGIAHIERIVGTGFGDAQNPLLVSVRSGARVSMPGMMDTVLNLGLNDATVAGLARASGNERFAYDSYRRFVSMYGDVVLGLKPASDRDHDPFEELLDAKKRARGVALDTELDTDDLRALVGEYKALIRERLGVEFPEQPWDQLWGAIGAVFSSWENPRAVAYRGMYGYPSSWGTAVNVQAMVFGNLGDDCATGVVFTREPATGERRLYGEFLLNAQGEDVVAGVRTPQPIGRADYPAGGQPSLEELMPAVHAELAQACARLEAHFGDMQDVEFTVQQGRLWILQTRSGKRTGRAMVQIAADLVAEGAIDEREALLRQEPEKLEELLHPMFDRTIPARVIARGLGASPGAAVGRVVFSADDAAQWAERGEAVILVRTETSPEDVMGMRVAHGILTARGGATSHAAVVARGMGKCCVTGCGALDIDYHAQSMRVATADGEPVVVRQGDTISLDGATGEVMLGAVALREPVLPDAFERLMRWADGVRRLRVRANADTPEDAALARQFGAEGIGLCRTEHMFFGEDRILAVRQMILADDEPGRRAALAKILPMQRDDFRGILRAMAGLPVTIRLLDPPLHEFLPQQPVEIADVAAALGVAPAEVARRVEALHESNPMLGHRGVRLAVTYPEIYEVQVRAIIEAACALTAEGVRVVPEIMIPLVGLADELRMARASVVATAETVIAELGVPVEFTVGTMIELPRACIVADAIAEHADFFSFGTNDLTQTTFGLSRDDASRFLPAYVAQGLLAVDPFVELDREGVGGLIHLGIERGRSVRPTLKVGICGEHGGNPASVEFCHQEGFDYVSCSPYRVPIARLAAAQAALAGADVMLRAD
ncbi:MAG: pyruvate, phosphate dikinase [Dehalococcoidia bacterium]|nr:pyruvate, phosphate dikinase [Dehalococcoidia bacterium]